MASSNLSLLLAAALLASKSVNVAFAQTYCDPFDDADSTCDCMGDVAVATGLLKSKPDAFGCTSNDVRVADTDVFSVDGKTIGPFRCVAGSEISVQLAVDFKNGASSRRSDIGLWLSQDGGDAETGNCKFNYFPVADTDLRDADEPADTDLRNAGEPADTCGDLAAKEKVPGVKLEAFTLTCTDEGGVVGGKVNVGSCIGWKVPGADQNCDAMAGAEGNYAAATLPATKSKCRCETLVLDINIVRPPTITKRCTDGKLVQDDASGVASVQWTVTVDITNNNDNDPLDSWVVEDWPVPFDTPLLSYTDGSIAAGATKTFTRTVSEALPSETERNLGFEDRVSLYSPDSDFDAVHAKADCPVVCDFSATCKALPIDSNCNAPPAETDPHVIFDISPLPCGDLVLSSVDEGDKCSGTITRTYTVLDDLNGNGAIDDGEAFAECVQEITVVDHPPSLTVPSDKTLECPADTSTDNTGVATAHDHCDGDLLPQYSDVSVPGCGGTETITRRWFVGDSCEQVVTAEQVIAVEDNTPPTLICPADAGYTCDEAIPARGTATATDTCGRVTVGDDGCCAESGAISRYYKATDECGNVASCTQTLSISCSIQLELLDTNT